MINQAPMAFEPAAEEAEGEAVELLDDVAARPAALEAPTAATDAPATMHPPSPATVLEGVLTSSARIH